MNFSQINIFIIITVIYHFKLNDNSNVTSHEKITENYFTKN